MHIGSGLNTVSSMYRQQKGKPLNGLSGIIRYRQKNNLLSIQFQPSYILMTVLERLTQTKKNNFD